MGRGKAFDPSRFFIFCANVMGSPYGSFSPVRPSLPLFRHRLSADTSSAFAAGHDKPRDGRALGTRVSADDDPRRRRVSHLLFAPLGSCSSNS